MAASPTELPPPHHASVTCDECGTDLPPDARFCPSCGATTESAPGDDPVRTYGTIATASLITLLGLIFLPAAILLWEAALSESDLSTAAESVRLLAALVATLGALGIVAADLAFVVYLSRPSGHEWRSWTQFFIVPMWLLAIAAALITAIDS